MMKPVYSDLNLSTGSHVAGICNVKVAPREWLTEDPVIDFTTGKILTAAAFIAGKTWLTLEFVAQSYDYNEKLKSNKSGSFYEISLSGVLNKYDADVQQVIDTIRYHEMVALVKDKKNKTKFLGNTQEGMAVAGDHTIKNNPGEERLQINLFMESEAPAPFYEV